MAPGKRRAAAKGGAGGNGCGSGGVVAGSKDNNQLGLGDLVLAKVKGFPAWPAKISRPEDWERAPDPKKYFVQFFGTEEIAFVAPGDIQVFTIEAKNKLSAHNKGKVRFFAQAVNEICEEFEQLQQKNTTDLRDDHKTLEFKGTALIAGGVRDIDAIETDLEELTSGSDLNQNAAHGGMGDHAAGLEHCSMRLGETEIQDVNPCTAGDANGVLSPISSYNRGSRHSSEVSNLQKELASAISPNKQSKRESWDVGVADNLNKSRPRVLTKPMRKYEESCEGHNSRIQPGRSIRHLKDGVSKESSVTKEPSQNILMSDLDNGIRKRMKTPLDNKNSPQVIDKPRMLVKEGFVEDKVEYSQTKFAHGKQNSLLSNPAKRSKHDMAVDITNMSVLSGLKIDTQIKDDEKDNAEVKSSVAKWKGESGLGEKSERSGKTKALSTTSDLSPMADEDVQSPSKRRRRALEAMSSSSTSTSDNRLGCSVARKGDIRRRAVRLCDEDEQEEPKTPIHEGSAKKVLVPLHGQASIKQAHAFGSHNQSKIRDSGTLDASSLNKFLHSGEQPVHCGLPNYVQAEEKQHVEATYHGAFSSKSTDSRRKAMPISPNRSSPLSMGASKSLAAINKANKHVGKVSGNISQGKILPGFKGVGLISDSLGSYDCQLTNSSKAKAEVPVELNRHTPELNSKANVSAILVASEGHDLQGERSEAGRAEKLSSSRDQKVSDSDSVMSMRHLIAAAQEKRKRAHLQSLNGNLHSNVGPNTEIETWSLSPCPIPQAIPSVNVPVLDMHEFFPNASINTPLADVHQTSSINRHDSDEFEDRRVNSGHRDSDGSLSGSTEAGVVRDAFEGMIETLSRTKESIGRATRLAIDCAKYGIANEVVELLVRKLENEPSFHRKVDLFFLVDSITQYSHNHKGIASASYIPAVQVALTRLLRAAAPPGPGARENRRQCLKVLRLWLERKILPESFLRRYMDDISGVNEDISSELSFRRPSRAERSVDDPIREMEGIMLDEYGSNATFKLPGFLCSRAFHEEDEGEDDYPKPTIKEAIEKSPSGNTPATADAENHPFSPNERRHHILEDVDGDLEMEDVSGHQKDERPYFGNVAGRYSSAAVLDSSLDMSSDLPPLPDGSPPLPLCSPPPTPPFPSSPPPMLPTYTPPPSPPPPPPSPSPPPPPPPLLPLPLPLPLPPPSVVLGPLVPPQQSVQSQPSILSQQVHVLPPSHVASTISHHPSPVPPEISLNPMANSACVFPVDSSVRHEVLQQASYLVPVGASSLGDPYGYNLSRHNSAYVNAKNSQSSQPFVPRDVPFPRPMPPNPQTATSHFSYSAPAVRQQSPVLIQHYPIRPQYPLLFPQPNLAEGSRQFALEERWRIRPNEVSNDHQHGVWTAESRSSSGPTYLLEGQFRASPDRLSAGTASLTPGANILPSGASLSGPGAPQVIAGKLDLSAVGWRPS